MAQIFRPRASTFARILLVGLVVVPLLFAAFGVAMTRSSYVTGEGRIVEQPVPFSHAHHTGDVGIDCRYCHTSVEVSAHAGFPPTTTCMTCHSQLWTNAAMLAPVRESLARDIRLRWAPVNRLPAYVYFNHSIHVAKGVGCTTCHGVVGRMRLTEQAAPLTMGWCLDCHRDPGPNLRPEAALFDPVWPMHGAPQEVSLPAPEEMMRHYGVDVSGLTDCSTCHR